MHERASPAVSPFFESPSFEVELWFKTFYSRSNLRSEKSAVINEARSLQSESVAIRNRSAFFSIDGVNIREPYP